MAEVTSELIYELLKRVHDEVAGPKTGQSELRAELVALREHQLAMQKDVANMYAVLHRQDDRLDRIEKRLDLTEPA